MKRPNRFFVAFSSVFLFLLIAGLITERTSLLSGLIGCVFFTSILLFEFKRYPFKSVLSGYFLIVLFSIIIGVVALAHSFQGILVGLAAVLVGFFLLAVYCVRPLRTFFLAKLLREEADENRE